MRNVNQAFIGFQKILFVLGSYEFLKNLEDNIWERFFLWKFFLKNDGVEFVNPHKETLEKIVRLDRNIERKIICLINSELSDVISKNKALLRLKQEKLQVNPLLHSDILFLT